MEEEGREHGREMKREQELDNTGREEQVFS
jgi:hypothetical protein